MFPGPPLRLALCGSGLPDGKTGLAPRWTSLVVLRRRAGFLRPLLRYAAARLSRAVLLSLVVVVGTGGASGAHTNFDHFGMGRRMEELLVDFTSRRRPKLMAYD